MTSTTLPASPTEKRLVLLSVCLAAMTMPLTFTGPAVALSSIARDLGGSPIALNWVTNAFMLTFGASLMATGALADSLGRKTVFVAGLAIYVLAALGSMLAPDIFWFDVLRAAQGVAGATAFSGGAAALAQEFDGRQRLRAFSLLGTSFGVGLAFGPIASGLLIDAFGWRAIFLLVAGLAAVALALALGALRQTRDPDAAGLDWPGAVAFTAALAALTYGVLRAPDSGWTDPAVIALFAVAVLCFAVFILVERRAERPMLDLKLFRYPRFVGVQLLAAAPAYAFVVLLVLLPIRFIGIEGMSEIKAGQLMICLSGPLLILPVVAGLLTRWFLPASICGTGLLIAAGGLVWLSQIAVGEAHVAIMAPMLMIGVGISLPWGLMDGLAVSVVPKERAGMAVGIFNTTRVASEGVALAVVTAILSGLTASLLQQSGSPANAAEAAQLLATGDLAGAARLLSRPDHAMLVQAYGAAFAMLLLVLAAITVVTAVVVFLGLHRGSVREDRGGRTAPQEG